MTNLTNTKEQIVISLTELNKVIEKATDEGKFRERNKIIDFLREDVEDGDTIADIIEARCK